MSCLSSIFVCGKHHDAANGEHVEPNGRPNNGHASGKAQLQPAPTVSSAGSGFNDMTPTDTGTLSPSRSGPLPPYTGAPLPVNEAERLNHLYNLNILETERDTRFDDITRLLCTIFKVPIAIVSLVEKERQWFKSIMGLPVSETDRSSSFCAWTLLPAHPEVLVVEDATKDARFKHNVLVKNDPKIRFYAGAPLVSSVGYRMGSLCIIDRKPRTLDAEACNVLCNFAEIVVRQIEKTTTSLTAQHAMTQQTQRLLRALNCFSEGLMMCQLTGTGWNLLYVNDVWVKITGIESENAINHDLFELFSVTDRDEVDASARCNTDFQVTATMKNAVVESQSQRFVINFRPAHLDPLDNNMPLIGIPSDVPWNRDGQHEHQYYFATIRLAEDVLSTDVQPLCEVEGEDVFPEVVLGPLLGKGSFGKVYRGIWKGVPVAVKLIQTDVQGADSRDKPGAKLEAAVSMSMSHPNIVQTYKTASRQCTRPNPMAGQPPPAAVSNGFTPGLSPNSLWRTKNNEQDLEITEIWILLEFCDMGTLVDAVEKGIFRGPHGGHAGPPVCEHVFRTALEIASAMCYCHGLNVLHGDLTGNNVLLVSSNRDPRGFVAKVTDFGLSRVVQETVIKTETFGTATHMPPELLTKGLCSKAVDVYAFGVLLWEMWNGVRAWAGMHQLQVIFNTTVKNKRLEFGDEAPADYVALANQCMDSDPDQRPSFVDIVARINEMSGGAD